MSAAELDWEAGCSCGRRGAGDDVEEHPCPLPDPLELLDCCGHPRERHYGEHGDGVPRCEFCDCSVQSWPSVAVLDSRPADSWPGHAA